MRLSAEAAPARQSEKPAQAVREGEFHFKEPSKEIRRVGKWGTQGSGTRPARGCTAGSARGSNQNLTLIDIIDNHLASEI